MQRNFKSLCNEHFDVLVCGGGIYGAWTAYDAALRGLKVALIDKGDWANGTSSASSKLIHGGLRYLESFNFKLVKKSLAERQMLLKTAPHLVWPLRFGIPVYHYNFFRVLLLKLGLALYDFLAGLSDPQLKHRYLSKQEFIQHFPALDSDKLSAGFTYFDAQTDDARLVIELIEGANQLGVACINYCELTEFHETAGKITHATVTDKLTQESITINAKQFIDTMGRWSKDFQTKPTIPLRLTKGIHLIMPKILLNEALLLNAKSDSRVFFIIPWYGLTLMGTTDTNFNNDDLNHIPISDYDIKYLLDEANQALQTVNWTRKDVLGKFAGIRVLQEDLSNNPSAISREWLMQEQSNGLLSSIGGKYTSAREDASALVDEICARLGVKQTCKTFDRPFPRLSNSNYQTILKKSLEKAKILGIEPDIAYSLVKRYGDQSTQLLALCEKDASLTKRIKPNLPFILADLIFCSSHEMVVHLDDLLRRRLPILLLSQFTFIELQEIATLVAPLLAWDQEKISLEINRCLNY